MSKPANKTGRRTFLKKAAVAGAGTALALSPAVALQAADRFQILSALGDTIVPSKPGDPGFKDFESHGITQAVNKSLVALKDQDFVAFNQASSQFFQGRTFVELGENERSQFLSMIVSGETVTDKAARQALLRFYKLVRISVLRVFYSNFPENRIKRDAEGIPVLKPGDLHQVTTPNSRDLVTAWDMVGYRGPLAWEQEKEMRERVQKIHWHDNIEDLIVRYRPKG